MPELSQAARNYIDDLARQPAARQPATIGEIWDSEWKRGGLDTIEGLGKPLADARSDLVTAIESAAGKTIADYAAEKRVLLGIGINTDQHIKALNDLADTLPEDAKKIVDPLRDVRRRAMQKAQQIERDAADVSQATYGIGGVATAWAAGIARQTVSLPNIAMMVATAPIGGPITGGAVKVIARQGAAGMVAQAAVEPYIEPARAELGLEAGPGRAATNILETGIGGAVLGGVGVGLHRLFRAAAGAYRGARPLSEPATGPFEPTFTGYMDAEDVAAFDRGHPVETNAAVGALHPNLTAEDFYAAALHAERDVVTEAPPGTDPVAHAEGVRQAGRAMEEGGPLPRQAAEVAAPEPAPVAAPQPDLPLPKPIEPKGPPIKEPVEIIGDPALAADLETRLANLPEADSRTFHIEQPDKTIKSGTAKSFLKEITDDAKAVSELIDCIGKEPPT